MFDKIPMEKRMEMMRNRSMMHKEKRDKTPIEVTRSI